MAVQDERRDRLWQRVVGGAARRDATGWAGIVCHVVADQVVVDGSAISVRGADRSEELVAATDDWSRQWEELQYALGEGPGVDAHAEGGPVLVTDLTAESRWPGFTDVAVGAGLRAVFAFPLQTGAIQLGTLTMYRRRPVALTVDELADAAVLADVALTALLTDIDGDDPANWSLESTPSHYEDVSVATGMLAVQLQISIEDAFARLQAHAFSHDRPLLEVARDVLRRELRLDSPD
jgi:hypothetical protein